MDINILVMNLGVLSTVRLYSSSSEEVYICETNILLRQTD